MRNLLPGLVSRRGDRLQHALQRLFVRLQIGRKAAFIANGSRIAMLLQHRLQVMKHFHAPAQRLVKTWRAQRHDHEFLHVHGIVRMRAAVQNIHHRHGQHVCRRIARNIAPDICKEAGPTPPQPRGLRPSTPPESRSRRICDLFGVPSASIIFRSSAFLIRRIHARYGFRDFAVYVADRFLEHSFAEISATCLRRAARWPHARPSKLRRVPRLGPWPRLRDHIRFHCRISARIENLAAMHTCDLRRHSIRS